MNIEFMWEMENGQLGSFLVENVSSLEEAKKKANAFDPKILACLVEVNHHEN
jgi:hypothetical protein